MKLLCIGGTRFSGRALTEQALAAGHEVTVFHRGTVGDDLGAEHLHGDRTEGLSALLGRTFDAVVDFCGYFPEHVRASAECLASSGWYAFVSSISAHPMEVAPGSDEDAPLLEPAEPGTTEITEDTYGRLKVSCENVVREVFGDRGAVVRPGFIVGPHDPTDRFPSLVRRAAAGGEMLAAGPPEGWMQFVDARDLGTFLLRLAEAHTSGTFSAVHPLHTATNADVLHTAREVAGADTTFTWPRVAWLLEALSEEARGEAFPMWAPEYPGFSEVDSSRAAAAGLTCRPLAHTIRDTLAWAAHGAEPAHGLAPEQERELLQRWHREAS